MTDEHDDACRTCGRLLKDPFAGWLRVEPAAWAVRSFVILALCAWMALLGSTAVIDLTVGGDALDFRAVLVLGLPIGTLSAVLWYWSR